MQRKQIFWPPNLVKINILTRIILEIIWQRKFAIVVFILTHLSNGQFELLPSLDVCRQSVC